MTFLYSQWVTVDNPIDVREIIAVDGTVVYDQVSSIGKPLGWGAAAFPHVVPYPDGPLDGSHTVVATMNGDPTTDIPAALRDRFAITIIIDKVHPSAIETLPADLRAAAHRALPGSSSSSSR